MKRLLAVVALVLASSAAQAQYVIEYGGNTIRIDPDRGTVSIPGVYDNTDQKKAKRTKRDQDAARKQPSATDKPAASPAEAAVAPAPQLPAPTAPAASPTTAAPASPAAAPASPAPVEAAAPPALVAPAPAPPAAKAATPVTPPAATTTAAAPAAPSSPAAVPPPRPTQTPAVTTAAAPSSPAAAPRDPNSPVGIWLTEEKEGKIRIEPCGANLCGYAVDATSNENREQILINMRPGQKSQDKVWSGRIFDPSSGSTYDSTIALKGPDSLKVQGCAFGGMFCGGQTWTRVN